MLTAGATTALTAVMSAATMSPARAESRSLTARRGEVSRQLGEMERRHSVRLGVFARNTATGETVRYRADERFPICSVFKTLAVAAVLRDLDRHGEFLAKRIHYTEADIAMSGGAPVTGKPGNLAHGMTVAQLCAAAVSYSDNTAANLLLRELGGPTAVTRFCRSLGDPMTRLDRYESELNSAEPWRLTDSTSPHSIGRDYARLVLGGALESKDRELLTSWLLANTTSGARFRAGLPENWLLADKTGTGRYGTANDVGIAWTPDGTPVVLTVLTTKRRQDATADEALIARTAALLAGALG
jgi:beta-lactamase class A